MCNICTDISFPLTPETIFRREEKKLEMLRRKERKRSKLERRDKKKHDNAEGSAAVGSAVAFVASFPILSAASTSASTSSSEITWVVDSGANKHCSAEISDFKDIKMTKGLGTVSGINYTI
jgi:hypothetical protein